MREVAVVESISNGLATVSVKRNTACGDSCATCGAKCQIAGNKIIVVNKKNAKPGDMVVIEMSTSTIIKSAFMVYILPLIVFFAGYLIPEYMGLPDLVSIITGIILFIITFYFLHKWDKKNVTNLKSSIVEIIKKEDQVK